MPLVDWKEIYAVDIAEIDSQHKTLVNLINSLHDAMLAGKGKDVVGNILKDLVDYTVYHFSTEEKYFDLYNYPEAELHKQQHKDLTEQAAALQNKYLAGEKVLTLDVMNFLRDWLHDHILGSDKLFGPYLKSKGLC